MGRIVRIAKPAAGQGVIPDVLFDRNRLNAPIVVNDDEFAAVATSGVLADELIDLGGFENGSFLSLGDMGVANVYSTVPRALAGTDGALAASGVELCAAVRLPQGVTITTVSFITGGTAANGPTAGYACLRSSDGTLLRQTADFGSTARAANTAYNVALSSTWQTRYSGLYYVGISLTVSTTMPTVRGTTVGNAAVAGAAGVGAPILVQSHGSTVGATAPASITSPTTTAAIPLLILS